MPDGLAVSFGASYLGFPTHLGFLRGLLARGWTPTAVAGSSAGSIMASFYAAGLRQEEIEASFTRSDLKRFFREKTFPWRFLATFMFRPGYPAVLTGRGLEKLLYQLLGDRRIEDCTKARLTIAVANLGRNAVELRTTGPLVETILASCALPGFLAPRWLDGELLWDGGLGSVVPVEQWIDDPQITHVAAHSLMHEEFAKACATPERHTFPSAMLAGHQLAATELLRWKIELLRRNGKIVSSVETMTPRPRMGFPMSGPAPKPWPEHARDFIAMGEATAAQAHAELTAAGKPGASC